MHLSAGFSGVRVRKGVQGKSSDRKPVVPGEKETEENSRSRGAKLRVFQRE